MSSFKTGMVATATVLVAGASALLPTGCSFQPPTCQSQQLVVRFESGQGAAGSRIETWQLTNAGSSCHVNGWVDAVNVDSPGRLLPTNVERDNRPHASVVLNRGQHASFMLRYTNPLILGCTPEDAAGMWITPPGNTLGLFVRPGIPSCNGDFDVTPLVAGG